MNHFWIGQLLSSKLRGRCLEKLYKMEGFDRQELGWTRKWLAKEKKGRFRLEHLFGGWGEGRQGSYLAYYLTGVDQEIPDWLVWGHILGRFWNCNQVLVCCPGGKRLLLQPGVSSYHISIFLTEVCKIMPSSLGSVRPKWAMVRKACILCNILRRLWEGGSYHFSTVMVRSLLLGVRTGVMNSFWEKVTCLEQETRSFISTFWPWCLLWAKHHCVSHSRYIEGT